MQGGYSTDQESMMPGTGSDTDNAPLGITGVGIGGGCGSLKHGDQQDYFDEMKEMEANVENQKQVLTILF